VLLRLCLRTRSCLPAPPFLAPFQSLNQKPISERRAHANAETLSLPLRCWKRVEGVKLRECFFGRKGMGKRPNGLRWGAIDFRRPRSATPDDSSCTAQLGHFWRLVGLSLQANCTLRRNHLKQPGTNERLQLLPMSAVPQPGRGRFKNSAAGRRQFLERLEQRARENCPRSLRGDYAGGSIPPSSHREKRLVFWKSSAANVRVQVLTQS
jgi:hypothetical protein